MTTDDQTVDPAAPAPDLESELGLPGPTPEQLADARTAQQYVQNVLTAAQTSALYEELINARIQIGQLQRQVTDLQQQHATPEATAEEAGEPPTPA